MVDLSLGLKIAKWGNRNMKCLTRTLRPESWFSKKSLKLSGSTQVIKKRAESSPTCWHRKIMPASLNSKPQSPESLSWYAEMPKSSGKSFRKSTFLLLRCLQPMEQLPLRWILTACRSHLYRADGSSRLILGDRFRVLTDLNRPDLLPDRLHGKNICILEKCVSRFKCFIIYFQVK